MERLGRTLMGKTHVLIPAAGKGVRSGLTYPKTLFKVKGKPILVHIYELLRHIDARPTVIVSPSGYDQVLDCLHKYRLNAHLVIQSEPRGMGDAVLHFADSPVFFETEHVLLIWGDIPFIQSQTLNVMINTHYEQSNDFTFVTKYVDTAYTVVKCNNQGQVIDVIETREAGIKTPQSGERDIGLFVFRKQPVFDLLRAELPGKWGKLTNEHGFLYVIQHLVKQGYRVQSLAIATDMDLISLNEIKDIEV